MERTYKTSEVLTALPGLKKERLRAWINEGFITPSIKPQGSGTRAGYTKSDIICIAIFRNLVEDGFKREIAAKYVEDFNKNKFGETDSQNAKYVVFYRYGGIFTVRKLEEVRNPNSEGWLIALDMGAPVRYEHESGDNISIPNPQKYLEGFSISRGDTNALHPGSWDSMYISDLSRIEKIVNLLLPD